MVYERETEEIKRFLARRYQLSAMFYALDNALVPTLADDDSHWLGTNRISSADVVLECVRLPASIRA